MCPESKQAHCRSYKPGKKCYKCLILSVLNYVLGAGLAAALYVILEKM